MPKKRNGSQVINAEKMFKVKKSKIVINNDCEYKNKKNTVINKHTIK